MSEYQYYEFCKINSPLSSEARKEMHSLSSRACVGTHNASYVYNYGDFRGKPKELLLKHFDVFFYISNYGFLRLMFKYSDKQVNITELKKYCIQNVITCEQSGQDIILNVEINDEEGGGGWIEGEGILPDLLPLYDEIKAKNYQFLRLASMINTDSVHNAFDSESSEIELSAAQKAFLDNVGIGHEIIS